VGAVRKCVCVCVCLWVVCGCVCACACVLVLARPCKALQGRAASGDTTQHLAGSGQAMTAVQVWAGSITTTLLLAFALAGWLGGRVGAELGKKREAERSAMEQQRIQADARRARRAWIGALAAAVRDEVQVGSGLVLSCGWWRRLRAAATAPRQGKARQSKARQGRAGVGRGAKQRRAVRNEGSLSYLSRRFAPSRRSWSCHCG
jgi:hypothetical protein